MAVTMPRSQDSGQAPQTDPGARRPVGLPRPNSRRERARLLSLAFVNLLKQRFAELSGFALVLAGALLGAALASYYPGDSSWDTFRGTDAAGKFVNLLGLPGAYVADLVLQWVGLGGYLAVAAFTVWGIRIALLFGLPRGMWRLFQLFLAASFAAVVLEALPPIPVPGLYLDHPGGSIGWMVNAQCAEAGPAGVLGGAGLSFVLAVLFFAGSLGVPMTRHLRILALLRATMARIGRRRNAAESETRGDPTNRGRPGPAAAPAASTSAGTPRSAPRFDDRDAIASGETVTDDTETAAAPRPPPPARLEAPEGIAYELPPLDLLRPPPPENRTLQLSEQDMRHAADDLTSVLSDFGVRGSIQSFRPGPVVTLYELEPAPGTKSSRVIGLADDIARSMSAVSVRVAVVPGRNVIGVELPNPKRETVWLRELFETEAYDRSGARLALVLGKDIGGTPVIADLARMPHLLIAGTTGSGKSVGINTMILSLLYRMPPEACKFIMVDPKMLELSVYDGIPHLLAPVVTDPKRAVVALKWTVREMEDRYRAMSKLGVRNIEGFNARLREARESSASLSRRVQIGFDPDTGKPLFEEQPLDLTELPYIVVVVDEMADLMLVAGKDIEATIQRLAQMARAAGIHLIMATQRPSVDVITGTIKANFPTRISFQVTSKIDSRTILGEQGAEQLLGQGDMLYMAGGGRITRVHGPFVSDEEVERVVCCLKAQGEPTYIDAVTNDTEDGGSDDERSGGSAGNSGGTGVAGTGAAGDDLYDKAVALVCRERKASTSFVQRYLRIGYNSAARLIERMEQEGVISKPNHAGKREVLAPPLQDDNGP
jgi:S-DNA-T family DNA segregation ATPase FtsK/SpoIIIE